MAGAATGAIAFVGILVAIILLWYFTVGFGFLNQTTTTTTSTATTTVTVATNTTTQTTTILYVPDCKNFFINLIQNESNAIVRCAWTGGTLGVWVGSGYYRNASFTITGANNKTYLSESAGYQCVTFYDNFTGPAQTYNVVFSRGAPLSAGEDVCPYPILKLNTTTTPPNTIYTQVYNGGFQNGKYTGWSIEGRGFGKGPINLTAADTVSSNSPGCYFSTPWANYNGTYFATTYNCGLSVAPGNITSSPFLVDQPFLNFRMVSPDDNFIYVEVLQNGTPYTVVHCNTFNVSAYQNLRLYQNISSTFRNISVPLYNAANKPVQIKVVADTLSNNHYIAIGDFAMSNRPQQDPGSFCNVTLVH